MVSGDKIRIQYWSEIHDLRRLHLQHAAVFASLHAGKLSSRHGCARSPGCVWACKARLFAWRRLLDRIHLREEHRQDDRPDADDLEYRVVPVQYPTIQALRESCGGSISAAAIDWAARPLEGRGPHGSHQRRRLLHQKSAVTWKRKRCNMMIFHT